MENIVIASKQHLLAHLNPQTYNFLCSIKATTLTVPHQCLCPQKTLKSTESCSSFFCHQFSHFVLTDLQQIGFQHRTCNEIQYGRTVSVCVLCLVGKKSLGVPGQRQQQMREAEHQSSHENPLYILLLLQADPYEMESSFLSPPLYLTPSSLTNPFLSFGQSLLPKVPSYCTTVEFTLRFSLSEV